MNTIPKRRIALGILVLLIVLLILPTPIHDWFVDTKVNGIPVKTGLAALVILFTPVTILANIMKRFDVDYADEEPGHDSGPNVASHAH